MIQITLNGNTYKSISAAWRAESPEGLPMITVRWRIKNGWPMEAAFTILPIDAQNRRDGYVKALIRAMYQKIGYV